MKLTDVILALLIGTGPWLALIIASAIAPHPVAAPSIINVPSIAHIKETPSGLVKPE